ncbi:hypothetical protein [Spirosoma rhododendri]|uniref:Outer membrane protein beta-barrel domain-containing protein n=1 Tax=Spirosoma rhododendri TaxID=2728024 RepID=A0A7L5DH90_9BACT|nr:hypothetical protein [Spirosoma rhododendri]QJD77676.1 hypothetical protein HH216_04025 [Spirosoma rhododendri]
MKALFVSILLLGLVQASFGQKTFILSMQDKKAFVAVSAGVSLPVGEYGSGVAGTQRASMAGPGLAVSLSAGYRLLDHAGLMAKVEQHRNTIQTRALVESVDATHSTDWSVNSGDWSVTTFMAGPYVTIPKGRFSFDGRILAGWARATMPDTQVSGTYGSTPVTMQTIGSQSSALTAGAGTTVRYRLNPWLSAHANADFSYAVLTFANLSSKAWSANGVSETPFYSSDRQICVVSASVGLTILLVNANRPF